MEPDEAQRRLERLRGHRNRQPRDLSLHFLEDQFKREVARPFRQVEKLVPLWAELLPAHLVEHSRLEGLQRGVLRVAVDSSARLYELNRVLKSGIERDLIRQHKGPAFRRIKLSVDSSLRDRVD